MNTVKKKYLQYIVDSFDCEELGIDENETPRNKARALLSLIEKSLGRNDQETVADYLRGLGAGITIEFWNSDILKRAEDFGLIDQIMNNSKFSKYKNQEKRKRGAENQIIENYFSVIAAYLLQIARH